MYRKYDQPTMERIVSATMEARRSGHSWEETLGVAKQAGYASDSKAALQKLVSKNKPKRKVGRPAGRRNKPLSMRSNTLIEIERVIDKAASAQAKKLIEKAFSKALQAV